MKTNLILTLILFLMMIFLPLIALMSTNTSDNTSEATTSKAQTEAATETVSVFSDSTGKVTEMSVEDYIFGSVCAEMPASFHEEALKAQAVACYTYMKWIKENSDNSSYTGADITDSSAVHQAFLTEEELRKKWGTSYDIYCEKVKDAVESVLFEYLTYENETAMTVFHALSTGETHSSEEVWNSATPYLQSVTAPGDKLSPDFSNTVTLTAAEFAGAFEGATENDADKILKSASEDENGFISELSFGNKTLSRTDIRSVLSLDSPYFKVKNDGDSYIFTVYGKGHGIGMSQYSADYMARQGSTYEEILKHFYKDTSLVRSQ